MADQKIRMKCMLFDSADSVQWQVTISMGINNGNEWILHIICGS